MATIEPRLIHLLNNPQTPDLPPIQRLPLGAAASASLSLPPLGPDLTGSQRGDKSVPTPLPPTCAVNDDHLVKQAARADDNLGVLTASIRPLQLLLGEPEPTGPTIPLRMLVDDVLVTPADDSTKKRSHRAVTAKEDSVQLPQPPKKQALAQQVVPPIIAGLYEPPPDAAVFPPITSAPFGEGEPVGISAWKEFSSGPEDRPIPSSSVHVKKDSNPPKAKRRPMKPRKKWTDEETNNLLLGVSRYGVGRWTSILEDPDFKFDGRTAGDLKDRFRTCCPEELRLSTAEERPRNRDSRSAATSKENTRPRNGLHLESILLPADDDGADKSVASPSAPADSDAPPRKRRRTQAHRKKLEDLVELGIRGPFEKSHRRKRRPFTKQDDKEILDGLRQYGPSWTRIQRDPKYNLSTRQPTDLRDRVRNKYPEIYSRIEKGSLQAKEAFARGKNHVLEPSVDLTDENLRNPSSRLSPQLSRSASKEDMSRQTTTHSLYEWTEPLPGLADIFDMNDAHGTAFLGSGPETDMHHHTLLDDLQVSSSEHLRYGIYDAAANGTSPAGRHVSTRFAQDS
ncbi:hypothetical protein VTK56DRAFT_2654 [Thermocarpiscus australiensis]